MTAVGIDLGTTYSVMASVDAAGRPAVVANGLGRLTTPSVVCFEAPGSVLVGEAAKNAMPVLPDRTVALIKRDMGTDRLLYFDDDEHTPESVSALILKAVTSALTARGEVVRAVVTVPAYFGVREREATQEACLLAGLEVLELVSEPVAAAIHYGLTGLDADRTVLVYDLGGGTFDATVMVTGRYARVVATDGDTELGGADWDRRLVGFLLGRFLDLTGLDPGDDEAFVAELTLTAEDVKKDLSTATTRVVPMRHGGATASVRVNREEFEEITRDLVERTLDCVRRLLSAAADKGVTRVDQVLLVGGSSRMPMIAAALGELLGCPIALHDPDFAVAKGAALRAAELAGAGVGRRAVPSASVVSRGFGLLVHDSHDDPSGLGKLVQHVIHRNDPLPVTGNDLTVATILDGQRSVKIEVYEQAGTTESPAPGDNRRILSGELTGLPAKLPAGSPIDIRFELGLDGRLAISATEPRSRARLTIEACIEGVLDNADRLRLGKVIGGLAVRQ
ncbi:Hsp70 family protein [Actinoplanes sp. NPDC089786]|uniref:Hsp70 family protein n=1 Tax=Actinoplanes sp. NPDC089786 TaxID=3155185 RepID=UPI003428F33B